MGLMIGKILAAALLGAAVAGAAEAEDEAVLIGLGATTSCAEFAKDYKEFPEETELMMMSWADGFLSGRNWVRSQKAPGSHLDLWPGDFDAEAQFLYIRLYCDDAPLVPFIQAVLALERLIAQRQGQ